MTNDEMGPIPSRGVHATWKAPATTLRAGCRYILGVRHVMGRKFSPHPSASLKDGALGALLVRRLLATEGGVVAEGAHVVFGHRASSLPMAVEAHPEQHPVLISRGGFPGFALFGNADLKRRSAVWTAAQMHSLLRFCAQRDDVASGRSDGITARLYSL